MALCKDSFLLFIYYFGKIWYFIPMPIKHTYVSGIEVKVTKHIINVINITYIWLSNVYLDYGFFLADPLALINYYYYPSSYLLYIGGTIIYIYIYILYLHIHNLYNVQTFPFIHKIFSFIIYRQ